MFPRLQEFVGKAMLAAVGLLIVLGILKTAELVVALSRSMF